MIVEVLIDGVAKYRWPINENEGIMGNCSWKNKVESREYATKKIIAQITSEVLPNLKESGYLEIYIVFESKFPEPEVDEAAPVNKLRPIILRTPPPGPSAVNKLISTYNRSERPDAEKTPLSRPPAEYSNRQSISNY